MKWMFVMALMFAGAAAADTGVAEDQEPPAPVDTEYSCYYTWLVASAELINIDPLTEEPCGAWDPELYDVDTSTCEFWCGSVQHLEAM